MHIKLACLALGAGLMAMPASAQAYRDCRSEQHSNQVAGTVIGGILGGVLGSNIAASGHRGDGSALGAALGAVAGSAAGKGTRACSVYGPGGYSRYGQTYPRETAVYSEQDREYRDYPYDDDGYYADRPYSRDNLPGIYRDSDDDRSYPYRSRAANSDGDYYGSKNVETRECRTVDQTTRLPDGSEVTRRAEACRPTRHGAWTVRD